MKLNSSKLVGVIILVSFSLKGGLAQTNHLNPDDEYWTFAKGYNTVNMFDNMNSVVLLVTDKALSPADVIMQNTVYFYHYDQNGNHQYTHTHNLSEYGIPLMELRSYSRYRIAQLHNGKFLLGAHGVGRGHNDEMLVEADSAIPKEFEFDYLPLHTKEGNNNVDEPYMLNPMIFTFNEHLDTIERVDTLEAVEAFGAVTLIHEVAPDTLIICFHKTTESGQQIMETDSLFNVRWKTDFGLISPWIGDVHDFLVTPEGDYLLIVNYFFGWYGHILGTFKNHLYRFDRETGQLVSSEQLWYDKGINFWASMATYGTDQYVIALDDCCENQGILDEIIFHEGTGLHLQIRDFKGSILEERNLAGFLNAFLMVFPGPYIWGEYPDYDPYEVAPWFKPHLVVRNEDDTYFISGMQYSDRNALVGRGFLIKLDAQLNPLWCRIFEIDKKNYPYGANMSFILYAQSVGEKIHVGGNFWFRGPNAYPSPWYDRNYPPYHISGFYINLDEHGCAIPGCHLTDQINESGLQNSIQIYPNPASESISIQVDLPGFDNYQKVLYISDMKGNQVLTQRFNGQQLTIPVNQLTPGVYLAYIFAHGQVMVREKIVVE